MWLDRAYQVSHSPRQARALLSLLTVSRQTACSSMTTTRLRQACQLLPLGPSLHPSPCYNKLWVEQEQQPLQRQLGKLARQQQLLAQRCALKGLGPAVVTAPLWL
jgi:hypothetical protein